LPGNLRVLVGVFMVQLVVVATNQCGVMARVTSVISCVGTNIVRCHVMEVPESAMSVLTFSLQADEPQTKAILRKLSRLVEVVETLCDPIDTAALHDSPALQTIPEVLRCSPSAV
jgi:glycine cleavage system regulatory protein